MRHTEYVAVNTPVVVRGYVSGIIVGRLTGGESGSVILTDWRWIRSWQGVGQEGSVYDLVYGPNNVKPTDRGPGPIPEMTIIQQADVMLISEDAYARLAGP